MRGLLDRLAALDSGAERGLRVIQFFDELVSHRADAEAVTRATAVLSEATAGVIIDETSEVHAIGPGGRAISTSGPGHSALVHDVTVGDEVVGRVWLERTDPERTEEWDELVIARFALTMANLFARSPRTGDQLGLTSSTLLHTLLRDDAPETETARAASLLGFGIARRVRVAAVRSRSGPVDHYLAELKGEVAAATGGRVVAATISESLAALIFTGGTPTTPLPAGVVACVGPEVPIEGCAQSWSKALRGVRFGTSSSKPTAWIVAADLGCLLALADLNPEDVQVLPDVRAIDKIAGMREGTDLDILYELGKRSSIREMAAALHMHHSSVAYRLDRISELLGFDVRTAEGSFRARTATLLWTLHASPASAADGDDRQ